LLSNGLTSDEAGRRSNELLRTSISKNNDPHSLPTLLAHAGMESYHNAPMSPPLHLATTHTRPPDGIYLDTDSKYGRVDNETRLLLERTVFGIECVGLFNNNEEQMGATMNKPSCFAFSSGMMAVTALILAHSGPMTVMIPDDVYHGVPTVLHNVFHRHNVTIQQVNMTSTQEIKTIISKLDETSDVIVWMETPSNPKCQIYDIQRICNTIDSIKSQRSNNITTVVDATMVSPVITRPLELGADVSMHSGTKYLGGHSDALMGILTSSPKTERGQELAPLLSSVQTDTGGIASAFDSWLTLRGLRTLQVRVERQSQTAQTLAEYLSSHPLITAVHYPGLASHPHHTLAKRQMENGLFGGVLSLEVKDEIMATATAGALETIQRATSLGGTETLMEHRASIEPPERRVSPQGLLRLSVGLEDPNDLIRDLDRALGIAKQVVSEGTS